MSFGMPKIKIFVHQAMNLGVSAAGFIFIKKASHRLDFPFIIHQQSFNCWFTQRAWVELRIERSTSVYLVLTGG